MRPIGAILLCRHRMAHTRHNVVKSFKKNTQEYRQTHVPVYAVFINLKLIFLHGGKPIFAQFVRALLANSHVFASFWFVVAIDNVRSVHMEPAWFVVVNHVLPLRERKKQNTEQPRIEQNRSGSSACHALCLWFIELGFQVWARL